MAETRWWCAYDDGTVWPCEILSVTYLYVKIRPTAPAPDAGEERLVDPSRVYDSNFNRATRRDAAA